MKAADRNAAIPGKVGEHVTKRSHPDLDWNPHPRGMWVAVELLQSDAYRSLTKIESDLLLFIYSRRKYPPRKQKMKKAAGQQDYWSPLNGHDMTVPYVAIREFFHRPGEMALEGPTESTISRAIKKLMHVGFISLEQLGGSGKGDLSRYRLAHNWRTWRLGDPACFEKAGMARRGFCQPGSGVFCPAKNKNGGQAGMTSLHADLHEKNPPKNGKGVNPA